MKYKSVNELDKFNLHDVIIEKMEIKDNNMTWFLKNANVIVENSQNNNKNDMCADVKLIFEEMAVRDFKWQGSIVMNEKGHIIKENDDIQISDENALEELKSLLDLHCCRILEHSKENDEFSYLFLIDIPKGLFQFILSFKNAITEWNEYKGNAWYVKR